MLILIRGLPGSGKSTYAKKLVDMLEADLFQKTNVKHFEADDFWEDREFNPRFLGLAHKKCQENTWDALCQGYDVVVANTFTRLWEMQPYLDMTEDIKVYRMTGDYGSIHNVPKDTIEKMKKRFEDFDGEIYV